MRKILFFLSIFVLLLISVGCDTSSANTVEKNGNNIDSIPEKEIDFEDIKEEKIENYIKASIDYFDASIGEELLVDKIIKAKKIETGEKFNENKLDVEIALKDEFYNTPKGLALPELIVLDLVRNKFNETGISGINEVEFNVLATVDGHEEEIYKVQIGKKAYKTIHENKVDLKRIIENADQYIVHDVYDKEIFKK